MSRKRRFSECGDSQNGRRTVRRIAEEIATSLFSTVGESVTIPTTSITTTTAAITGASMNIDESTPPQQNDQEMLEFIDQINEIFPQQQINGQIEADLDQNMEDDESYEVSNHQSYDGSNELQGILEEIDILFDNIDDEIEENEDYDDVFY